MAKIAVRSWLNYHILLKYMHCLTCTIGWDLHLNANYLQSVPLQTHIWVDHVLVCAIYIVKNNTNALLPYKY